MERVKAPFVERRTLGRGRRKQNKKANNNAHASCSTDSGGKEYAPSAPTRRAPAFPATGRVGRPKWIPAPDDAGDNNTLLNNNTRRQKCARARPGRMMRRLSVSDFELRSSRSQLYSPYARGDSGEQKPQECQKGKEQHAARQGEVRAENKSLAATNAAKLADC